jgi:arylsulfatase A-like enzyme
MGRLFGFLQEKGLMDNTLIVITSDHGDYLGDHWMGEKDLFHEPSVRIPLIIYDPTAAADTTRGTVCDELVEAIDVTATLVEAAGGEAQPHRLEGRSLLPFLHGEPVPDWRNYVISEYDYSSHPVAARLGVAPKNARLYMVADKRWKFVHAKGFRPQLFDLQNDPQEFHDLGADAAYAVVIQKFYGHLTEWALRDAQRTTKSDHQIIETRGKSRRRGILLGVWDESDVPEQLTVKYRGRPQ